ncbi:hypothetical protein ILYODFUR_022138 [Ilyodon furcidens]|uniref:Uncharacterized protein n=1 Tax=Ilyodon furcidens TaxID=33524 RepID=A0ABV0V555_9TELE
MAENGRRPGGVQQCANGPMFSKQVVQQQEVNMTKHSHFIKVYPYKWPNLSWQYCLFFLTEQHFVLTCDVFATYQWTILLGLMMRSTMCLL